MRVFVIVSALLFVAARAHVRVHNRSTSDQQSISHQEQDKDVEKIQRTKESTGSSQVRVSSVATVGHLRLDQLITRLKQRTRRHTSSLNAVKPPFGLTFHKCAQVETEGVFLLVRVMLVIANPAEGSDLSQLCIRDAVSDVTLLQTNGSLQERGYQTFTTDSLPAGSEYVLQYRLSLKENRNQLLILPAFLTFSNATQNDIHLFGPLVANFTLRIINNTHQDGVVLFLTFMGSFLLMVLLLSVTVGGVNFLWHRRLHKSAQRRTRNFSEDEGPYEGIYDIIESANQEAAFEDKFVDIMMLEDPQNMIYALDSLNISTRLRSMVMVEHVRVQIYEGLLVVLLRGIQSSGRLSVQAEQRVLGVVHGQIVGMEGKVQEEHVARMEALAARCNLETREEMELQQHAHASERSHAECLFQQIQQQNVVEDHALLEKLHKEEQRCLQRRLLAKHEHASAQAQRQQALQRRFELHKIFGEELQEATITGELQKNTANKLLLQYYGCQDSLEEVLDVLLANQRALLSERHAQRRFLVQSFQILQAVINDAFSSIRHCSADRECDVFQESSDVQSEVSRVKRDFEDSVSRECRAIRCDIIKRRRQLLSEMVCGHRRQLRSLCEVSDITVKQYLQKWSKLLLNQSAELSELINHLDKHTAASIRRVTLGLLQGSLAQLKAHAAVVCPGSARFLPQANVLQEKLQSLSEANACSLQSTQSCIQHIRLQELQEQKNIRDAFREYCSCVCASQPSLSHEHWLRVQLECVKTACCLDHCLVLPCADPAATSAASEMQRTSQCRLKVIELKHLQESMQERMQLLQHTETENDRLQREWSEACVFQGQQLRVCQERVAAFVAALQYEHAEKTAKVTETHSALLKLHTLITRELHKSTDITQAVHTHCLALGEAELQLQKEDVAWEQSVEGRGFSDDDDDDDVFGVDSDSRIADVLREALNKRQHLTQRLTDRVLRKNQTVEYQRDQIQLKRLNTYWQQDLDLTAMLVSQALITVPDLHEVLRLLLPTVPEGELLSLIDALEPKAGSDSEAGVSLAHRLGREVLSKNLSHPPHHRDRERDKLLKKRQKLRVKLFSGACSSEDVSEVQRRHKQVQEFSQTQSVTLNPELQITEEVAVMRDDEDEGAWPNKDAPHEEGHVSSERLFIFRCTPPAVPEDMPTTRRKKRSYLNFKKNSITPQQQT